MEKKSSLMVFWSVICPFTLWVKEEELSLPGPRQIPDHLKDNIFGSFSWRMARKTSEREISTNLPWGLIQNWNLGKKVKRQSWDLNFWSRPTISAGANLHFRSGWFETNTLWMCMCTWISTFIIQWILHLECIVMSFALLLHVISSPFSSFY